jgi:hypothetical protein
MTKQDPSFTSARTAALTDVSRPHLSLQASARDRCLCHVGGGGVCVCVCVLTSTRQASATCRGIVDGIAGLLQLVETFVFVQTEVRQCRARARVCVCGVFAHMRA